ncbi:unnamed protein product (macronuclear) [Paramecium tetraurelia]|uniref:Uncharacterized protein n=1 Tax=Paramecium tetraurelia TaxID=5888 RepID=A0CJ34_PARTE|nr:uncharacterized protein GSPATT00007936001 [Paramecium tetraurelia]CAK70801.1 unnamed protein product [Paramecium tetraurelia]|eukprot:XP_001438198.1 hypothetical protein (macronuclear) [Paramecium tetraurelia strain d4-2]
MKSLEASEDNIQKYCKYNEQSWKWQEGIFQVEGIEQRQRTLKKTNFLVQYTKDRWIHYIQDGCMLRKDRALLSNEQPEIYKNLEHIKYLRWEGEYGGNQKKVGMWNAFWRGDNLKVGGLYNENGLKQGKWVNLFPNYNEQIFCFESSISQVTYSGYYNKGVKQGEWTSYLYDKQIASGIYNEYGQKNGIWYVCSKKSIKRDQMVTFVGEYDNGVKFGRWNIFFQSCFFYERQLIGGGDYNENGLKNGFWIDINENYNQLYRYVYFIISEYEILYTGLYDNGKKQGQWDIEFKDGRFAPSHPKMYLAIQNKFSGGGVYDENEQKTGKWIELHEDFRNVCQVILEGEYVKGIKQGKWITQFRLNLKHKFKIMQVAVQLFSGGGNYDLQGRKIGKWIDMNDNFWKQCQVIESGQYDCGKRKGSWIIKFRYTINKDFNKIGGGKYDDQGIKNGKWVEIFKSFQNSCQVILTGDYLDGKKVENWKISVRDHEKDRFQQIGGGTYDQNGLKDGKWIDLIENFTINNQVIMKGEYLFGKKQGQWNTLYKKDLKLDFYILAGGSYNKDGEKNGIWIDLNYSFGKEVGEFLYIFMGTYKNGLKMQQFTRKNLYLDE